MVFSVDVDKVQLQVQLKQLLAKGKFKGSVILTASRTSPLSRGRWDALLGLVM